MESWHGVVDGEGAVALGLLMPGSALASVSELVYGEIEGACPAYERVVPWNYRPSLQASQSSRRIAVNFPGLDGVRTERPWVQAF